jgi:uncharacterized protein (DUF1786 family)
MMQILAVDVGTGTQDIYLFHDGIAPENGYRLIGPSPTMRIRAQIQHATAEGQGILLTGVTMGGGPCQWAAEQHLKAGLPLFATPAAARTFNDDLEWVRRKMGVQIISEDEARRLKHLKQIEMRDFDYEVIAAAFSALGARLQPAAVAIAVFDHGAAPAGVSDRQFRFAHLERRIREKNSLTAFAYRADEIPSSLTRMLAVAESAASLPCPLLVMDSAPAAILGATLDPLVASASRLLAANVGNFHTLAFRLSADGIEGMFEHHTGMLDTAHLDALLAALANGTLTGKQVYHEQGHGALVISQQPLSLQEDAFGVAVTGPRRSLMRASRLRPYFAVPFGDMMMAGCFGLLLAVAERFPELAPHILSTLKGRPNAQMAPWDLPS